MARGINDLGEGVMETILLLGSTTAFVAGRRVAGRDFGGTKVRQILEILALTPGRPVAKEQLAELLWEGAPPRSWRTTLEASLRASELALEAGDVRAAAEHAGRATEVDPLDERGWRLRMQGAWADGDRGAALSAYAECRDRLHRELGVTPAPVTQRLHQQLLAPAGTDLVDALLGQLVDVLLAEGGWAAGDPNHELDQRTLLDTNALAARIARTVQARAALAQREAWRAPAHVLAALPSA